MRLAPFALLPMACFAQQVNTCSADGSVVNSITGEPIPRARVLVVGPAQSGTVTDALGHWQMSGVPCARATFNAMKAGFIPRGQTVAPGHDTRIELVPQSVVTGKVIDDSGDPVQNAQVAVLTSRVFLGKRTFQQSGGANSNDLGEFRIAGLAAGKVILCARSPFDMQSIDSMVTAESCYPGPVVGGVSSAMTLPAGREARVDFTLAKVPAARIRGKVSGIPEGTGLALMLQPRGGGGPGRNAALERDGTFEVRAVPPGSWMLAVDYWEGGKRLMARVPVEVGGSDVDGVVVRLDAGFSVTGTLRVESQTGRTPPQLNVSLRGADPTSAAGAAQWDKNRAAFTIGDVMPGSYTFNLNTQAPFYLKSAVLAGRDITRDPVPIAQAAGPIDVVVSDDSGSIQGHIEDANGEPVAGWVMLSREDRPPTPISALGDGHFKMVGLAPGDYKAYAWDDFTQVEYADPDWMRRNAGPAQTISITPGQSLDLKLVRATVPRD